MIINLRSGEVAEETRWNEIALWVVQAQEGDRDAMGRLIEQFERTVYAICLGRLGNASEASELTQEVFLQVLRRIDQIREPERFAGWLRQMTVRMAINRATRRPLLPSVEDEILEVAVDCDHDESPLENLIAQERADAVREALARLKPLDRETLVDFYIHGLSLIEIADRLDVPVGTVKRRLHVARHRLRELLIGDGDEGDWMHWKQEVEELELVGV